MKKVDRGEIGAFREMTLRRGTLSNFFGASGVLFDYADRGCLYMLESQAGVFMLADAGGFFRLYFALTDVNEPFSLSGMHVPVVTEIAYRGDVSPAVSYCVSYGFNQVFTRSRMGLNNPDCVPEGEVPEQSADINLVQNLFNESFNRYTGCVPSLSELRQAADEGRVITVFEDGALRGSLFYEYAGNASTLRNIAVSPDTRGRGLGGRMLLSWFSRCAAAKKPVLRLWVSDENPAAVRLYEKHGFKPDGMKSAVLMYTKE